MGVNMTQHDQRKASHLFKQWLDMPFSRDDADQDQAQTPSALDDIFLSIAELEDFPAAPII